MIVLKNLYKNKSTRTAFLAFSSVSFTGFCLLSSALHAGPGDASSNAMPTDSVPAGLLRSASSNTFNTDADFQRCHGVSLFSAPSGNDAAASDTQHAIASTGSMDTRDASSRYPFPVSQSFSPSMFAPVTSSEIKQFADFLFGDSHTDNNPFFSNLQPTLPLVTDTTLYNDQATVAASDDEARASSAVESNFCDSGFNSGFNSGFMTHLSSDTGFQDAASCHVASRHVASLSAASALHIADNTQAIPKNCTQDAPDCLFRPIQPAGLTSSSFPQLMRRPIAKLPTKAAHMPATPPSMSITLDARECAVLHTPVATDNPPFSLPTITQADLVASELPHANATKKRKRRRTTLKPVRKPRPLKYTSTAAQKIETSFWCDAAMAGTDSQHNDTSTHAMPYQPLRKQRGQMVPQSTCAALPGYKNDEMRDTIRTLATENDVFLSYASASDVLDAWWVILANATPFKVYRHEKNPKGTANFLAAIHMIGYYMGVLSYEKTLSCIHGIAATGTSKFYKRLEAYEDMKLGADQIMAKQQRLSELVLLTMQLYKRLPETKDIQCLTQLHVLTYIANTLHTLQNGDEAIITYDKLCNRLFWGLERALTALKNPGGKTGLRV